MKKIAYLIVMTLFILSCNSKNIPQTISNQDISIALEEQNFRFITRTVQPARGKTIFMNEDYDLKISPNKIEAYLPYFGQAYVAPINPSEGGIKFTSEDFSISSKKGKKGNTDYTIKIHNPTVVQQMFLNVYPDGSASLSVTPVNKQYISYRGAVEPM